MPSANIEDTICAISTPIGTGGIGIVRLSGPESFRIAEDLFRARDGNSVAVMKSHTLKYGHVVLDSQVLDEALLTVMRAPSTYTREDVVEINCHGGIAAVRLVLDAVLHSGARLAEPGEFTKRAFLNGRIDLTQAEAVLDVITSRTKASLRAATSRLEGKLGARVRALRERLADACAHIEAAIDFPEEDVPEGLVSGAVDRAAEAGAEIEELIESSDAGMLYREGVTVSLTGKPNVGKSSLFNLLLRDARAIVTEEPGTTRDVIEETISISGVPVRLLDSAGMREPTGKPEQIGVEYARRAMQRADLVLFVLDAAEPLTTEDREIAQSIVESGKQCITVLNKVDLPARVSGTEAAELSSSTVVKTSAVTSEGLDELEQAVAGTVFEGKLVPPEDAIVACARELECLERARDALARFAGAVETGIAVDVAVIDLHDALNALGELVGEVTTDDLLDRIFGEFCIGK